MQRVCARRARPSMRIPCGDQAPRAAAFLTSRRRGPFHIPVPGVVWKAGGAGRGGAGRNPSAVRPDGRRGAATPGPAGPAFGPEGGPKEEARPLAARCWVPPFPAVTAAGRARRPLEAVRRGSRARPGTDPSPPAPCPGQGERSPPAPKGERGNAGVRPGRAPDSGARFPRGRVGASVTATRHRWGRLGSAPPIAGSCLGPGVGRAALDIRG